MNSAVAVAAFVLVLTLPCPAQDPPRPPGQNPSPTAQPPVDPPPREPAPPQQPPVQEPVEGIDEADEPALRFGFSVATGFGTLRHRTGGGSALNDETDAQYLRVETKCEFDNGDYLALRIEGFTSDDDLFADIGGNASRADLRNVFFYASNQLTGAGRFRLPVNLGITFGHYEIDDRVAGGASTYDSFGFAIELAPSFALVDDEHARWEVFGTVGLGFGVYWIEIEPGLVDAPSAGDDYWLEVGTRLQIDNVDLAVSWMLRESEVDTSDVDPWSGFYALPIEHRFRGLLVTAGIRF